MSVAAVVGTAGAVFVLVDLVLAAPVTARRFPALARTSSGAVRGPLAWVLAGLIRLYRAGWSGRNAGCCRFEPSCSAYALTAVTRHGGAVGGLFAVRRLLRCQPLSAGGYDPVPGAATVVVSGFRAVETAPVLAGADRSDADRPRDDRVRVDRWHSGRVHAGPGRRTASLRRGTRSEIEGSRRGTRV